MQEDGSVHSAVASFREAVCLFAQVLLFHSDDEFRPSDLQLPVLDIAVLRERVLRAKENDAHVLKKASFFSKENDSKV